MKGFGIHSSIWTMDWTPEAAERSVAEAVRHGFDFIEIALLKPTKVDTGHSRNLFERAGIGAVCSLGLPEPAWPSRDPQAGIDFLKVAIDATADMGALALSDTPATGASTSVSRRSTATRPTSSTPASRRWTWSSASARPTCSSISTPTT